MLTKADEGGKGGKPNADHCWRRGVQEPLILADVTCEQPLNNTRTRWWFVESVDEASFGVWRCRHRLVCDSGEWEGEGSVMEGERPSCPQLVTFPHVPSPNSATAWLMVTQQTVNHHQYLWLQSYRVAGCNSPPVKCMVLCHVIVTTYAKPVGVHNERRQTNWLCILGLSP